jgi:hypothetical protein
MITQYQAIDREAIWAALFAYLRARLTAPAWAADTAYALGDICTDPNGHLQKAIVAGTSGATLPAFSATGGTVTDGSSAPPLEWQDAGAGFVSMGRKHKAPPDLVAAEQPAMFLVQVKETHAPKPRGVPTRLTLHGFVILYLQAPVADEEIGQETVLAATQLNELFQALDSAFEPDDLVNGVFTLNGLFSHCWIEGDTDQDPGIFGSQAAAILPIHILVP